MISPPVYSNGTFTLALSDIEAIDTRCSHHSVLARLGERLLLIISHKVGHEERYLKSYKLCQG
jgi:hypothetical protein